MMEIIAHYRTCCRVLSMVVLVSFALGADAQDMRAEGRREGLQRQDHLSASPEVKAAEVRTPGELKASAASPGESSSGSDTVASAGSRAVKRPMPEPCGPLCGPLHDSCWSDADCANDSRCVPAPLDEVGPGICYVPKNRYISIASHPFQVPYTARRIRCASDGMLLGWVGTPWEHWPSGEYFADVVASPVYVETWPDVVHMEGSGIMPRERWYDVQAIDVEGDIGDEGSYSEPLALPTVAAWWDVVGGDYVTGVCTPPDGVCDEHDEDAMDDSSCSLARRDVCPQDPDQSVDSIDLMCVAGCLWPPFWEPWCDEGPPNDDCENAIDLNTDTHCANGLPCTVSFNNTLATTDGPDPECGTDFGADIWYEFHTQAGEYGWLTLDACEDGTYDGIMAVYAAGDETCECPVVPANMISCGDDTCGVPDGMPLVPPSGQELLVGDPSSPKCYLIRVGSSGGDYGSGRIEINLVRSSPIPAVSEWGMLVMTLVVLAVGAIVFRRASRRSLVEP